MKKSEAQVEIRFEEPFTNTEWSKSGNVGPHAHEQSLFFRATGV